MEWLLMNEIFLTSGMTNAEIMGIKECFSPIIKEYKRGETITLNSYENDTIVIVTSGTAYLCTINSDDQRRIIEYYQSGNIFGKYFLPNAEEDLYYIIAKTNCTVNFISYKKLITCCKNNCEKHFALIDSLFKLSFKKSLLHINILGQRTIRNKLLFFFEHLKMQNNSNAFTLPMPFSDLADYLAVDRSAMMRELKKLNDEKIIKTKIRKITLL